ncbi:hypothetical protein [Actinosynnema sp. NPDC023587]|uniref:hypothetical protein n=1 Tax=Actinosynnema sp. NPDC023587 TaxID=3154695 RepID=UPI0033FAB358
MPDDVIDARPEQVMAVIEQMVDLPWPDGDESLDWEIDGLAGQTGVHAHVLPLGATSDAAALASLTTPLVKLADQRWVVRYRFDATLFTDDDTDPVDPRSAPASLVRALGPDNAALWRNGKNAVILVDNSATAPATSRAAVLVLPAPWLAKPAAEKEEWLQSPLVADFLSGDKSRILAAVWAVFATRDPASLVPLTRALPAIAKATANAELGGALASNSSHLDHVLDRIELFGKGTCLCAAYLSHQFYDPAKEERRGHVRVVETVPNDGRWVPDRICECGDCGKRFQVEYGEYHYPWWKWTEVVQPKGKRA